jgi:hypothetical protein
MNIELRKKMEYFTFEGLISEMLEVRNELPHWSNEEMEQYERKLVVDLESALEQLRRINVEYQKWLEGKK